ncbi:MAG: c-type cytochrome, partial [Pseudomonadota bacterium]
MRLFAGLLLGLCQGLVLGIWPSLASADEAAELYAAQCAACHGTQALGNAATWSPRLAGQNAAYLQDQLLAYQQGQRGAHPDDVQGQAMRALVQHLTPAQIQALSAYLAALAAPVPEPNANPNELGAELYASHCATCHGQYGQGAESIYVPDLRILSAWYLQAQLESYAKGWRGGAQASTRAKNMRSMSK